MQTKQLIQSSANILKVTSLNKGDCIKIVDETFSDNEIKFGVVTDLLNSGSKTYIQALLYSDRYGELKAEIKTFSGEKDIAMFPATKDEVEEKLKGSIERLSREVKKDEERLMEKKRGLKAAEDFVSFETQRKLNDASFEEITQEQYNQVQAEARALLD